jgi:hypothetical protein
MLYSISVKSVQLDATQFSQTGPCIVSTLKDMSLHFQKVYFRYTYFSPGTMTNPLRLRIIDTLIEALSEKKPNS